MNPTKGMKNTIYLLKKSKLRLIIDGNWLLISRLPTLNDDIPKRQLLDTDSGSLSVNSHEDININYGLRSMRSITKDDSWQLEVTVLYKFNATQSKYKGTGTGQEERSRLGNQYSYNASIYQTCTPSAL